MIDVVIIVALILTNVGVILQSIIIRNHIKYNKSHLDLHETEQEIRRLERSIDHGHPYYSSRTEAPPV